MTELYFLGQLVLAVFLGAILGWQRVSRGKPAGPRTYALVTAGAALFTILSVSAFSLSDPSRVASQIVVGIGFLGAGIIFKKDNHTEGLTTAAGLWITAAIGMAVGVHYYLLAGGTTLIIFILLTLNDQRFKKSNVVPPEDSDQTDR